MDELYGDTRRLLAEPAVEAAVKALTEALLERGELSGREAKTILNRVEAKLGALRRIECPHCEGYESWGY